MIDSEYLTFEDATPAGRKTKVVIVRSKSSQHVLGKIQWYGAWRQYTFWPSYETIFNKGCMLDILTVIDVLMAERRENTKEARLTQRIEEMTERMERRS